MPKIFKLTVFFTYKPVLIFVIFQGVEERGSSCWERLELEVLSTFQERNIIKVISTSPTVLQIFSIRQLVQ